MLKHALHVCVVAGLVLGGVFAGYRRGRSSGGPSRHSDVSDVSATVKKEASASIVSMPGEDFALMQRPVERSIKLDAAPMVGLFGPPVLSGDPNPTPPRIDYGIPIASEDLGSVRGNFNFNIGYQF